MTAFTTVCDLLWIGVPSLRPLLYNPSQGATGAANANLLGRNMAWTGMAQNNMNKANQYNTNAQVYQQQAQNLAAMGDVAGAQQAMRRANGQSMLAQQQQRFAQRNMQHQAESDSWRTQANQRTLDAAQRRAENNRDRSS